MQPVPPTRPGNPPIAHPTTGQPGTPATPSPFSRARYRIPSGTPAGDTAAIRDDDGHVLLTYRGFASVVGIVAALMSAIVLVAGVAAVLFLFAEGRVVPAALALLMSIGFSAAIAVLVPSTSITLYEGQSPALTVAQQSRSAFPSVTYAVTSPEGTAIAYLRKSVFSRLGRNRWRILSATDPEQRGFAVEESLGRALMRKIAGKFNRRFETNVRIEYSGVDVGWIYRRPTARREPDVLDVTPDRVALLDRRVAVALAVLILGSEP